MKPTLATISLVGECNQCGRCCMHIYNGEEVFCEHLRQTGEGLGNPSASYCDVYETRTDGMPIAMLNEQGKHVYNTICSKDSELETRTIVRTMLSCYGCSLSLKISFLK